MTGTTWADGQDVCGGHVGSQDMWRQDGYVCVFVCVRVCVFVRTAGCVRFRQSEYIFVCVKTGDFGELFLLVWMRNVCNVVIDMRACKYV